jgi:GAF domain-containing protein
MEGVDMPAHEQSKTELNAPPDPERGATPGGPGLEAGPDGLLRLVVGLGRRIFAAAACSVALLEADDEHLVFRAASGEGAEQVTGMRLPVVRGIAGWVVSSQEPIAVDDVRLDPRFAQDVAAGTGYVPRSILAAPLEADERVLGVIEVLDRSQDTNRDDLALLCLLAEQAALGISTSRPLRPATEPPHGTLTDLCAELSRLGADEQQAAVGLLRGFLDYVRRPGGPAGLV